jgi:hypothetical protein
MACKSLVLCKRPSTPLKQWMIHSHQVLRVIWVPPGESREVLAGLLGVSILVSMLVMFMFWHTNPVCKQQDMCNDACGEPSVCPHATSPYLGMTVNIMYSNASLSAYRYGECSATAINWANKPGNVRFLCSVMMLHFLTSKRRYSKKYRSNT